MRLLTCISYSEGETVLSNKLLCQGAETVRFNLTVIKMSITTNHTSCTSDGGQKYLAKGILNQGMTISLPATTN